MMKKHDDMKDIRSKAEIIVAMENGEEDNIDIKDVKELVHELKVYQSELEIQNEELKLSRNQLEKSKNKYINIFQYAPLAYITLDRRGQILDCNREACELLGYSPEHILLKPFIICVNPEFQDIFFNHIEHIFNDGIIQDCEITLRSKKGRNFFVRLTSMRMEDEQENICLTAITDIDSARNAERFLMEAKVAAEHANSAKTMFLANMSHEIRTPMNGIMGMTDLMLSTPLTDEQKTYLNMLKTSTISLLGILNDILDYSKIEEGKVEIEKKPFNLRKVLSDTIGLFYSSVSQKNIKFNLKISDEIPLNIAGDALKLKQILSNLISNAVKFTQQGYINLSVNIEEKSEESVMLRFEVSDSGIGIPQDKQDMLFKVFSQIDNSYTKSYAGTGLGLAICKKLVNLMGGDIWLESKEGKGSHFYFTLKLELKDGETPKKDNVSILNYTFKNDRSKKAILAEDDEISSKVAGSYLSKSGFDVSYAKNGQEAVELYKTGRYDIIFMDVQMPLLDGLMATAEIRRLEMGNNYKTPIIALTAYSIKGDMERCIEAGMDDYISKPIEIQEFFVKVSKWT